MEALAGAALRSYLQRLTVAISPLLSSSSASRSMKSPRPIRRGLLPTLIVSPQDGVQAQWYETLLKAGVEPSR